jgi:hypothetical protein
MNRLTKKIGAIGLALAIIFCVNTSVKAQTPDDDPGIGGPGSGGSSPGDDGGPVVPFDGGMSLMLLASGVGYAAKRMRRVEVSEGL